MIFSNKIEIAPTPEQRILLLKSFGVYRFIYNWGLNRWNEMVEKGQKVEVKDIIHLLFKLKSNPDYSFIQEVSQELPFKALYHLEKNWKESVKEEGKQPHFLKKGCHDLYLVTEKLTSVDKGLFFLPTIGWILMRQAIRYKGRILTVSVAREVHKFFIVLTIDNHEDFTIKNLADETIGVDLGTRDIALSTGEKIEVPQNYREMEKKIANIQRRLSLKDKGSHNYARLRLKLQKKFYTLKRIRTDYLHKVTTYLAKSYQRIAIEDLDVKQIIEKTPYSKSATNAGFGFFRSMLTYKAMKYGSKVIVIPRFYPSSKICHCCGEKNNDLEINDRTWQCPTCHEILDRDINAAINLKNQAEESSIIR